MSNRDIATTVGDVEPSGRESRISGSDIEQASGISAMGSLLSKAAPSCADPTEHGKAKNINKRKHGRIFFTTNTPSLKMRAFIV